MEGVSRIGSDSVNLRSTRIERTPHDIGAACVALGTMHYARKKRYAHLIRMLLTRIRARMPPSTALANALAKGATGIYEIGCSHSKLAENNVDSNHCTGRAIEDQET